MAIPVKGVVPRASSNHTVIIRTIKLLEGSSYNTNVDAFTFGPWHLDKLKQTVK